MDLKEYHRQRRILAKRAGICIQCNDDQAAPGRVKCPGCIEANRMAYENAHGPRKAAGRKCRFTPEQVASMHHDRSLGRSLSDVATKHGCCPATVARLTAQPKTIAA